MARWDAEESLSSFIQYTWSVLEPGREFIDGWSVDAICEHLEAVSNGEIRRLLMNVPPGFMKSLTTNVFWPAWEWGPRNQPTMRYVSASYSEALTTRDNRRCRNLINSSIYQSAWGDRFQIAGDQNAKVRYDTDKTGFKIATSVGGLGTGERGDRFIIDDPHNIKETESDAVRESALQWFTEVVPTRMNDPDKSAIIVIMQRVHERDISGLILREELGYDFLCLPMEYERRHRCYTPVKRKNVPSQRVTRVMQEQDPIPWWAVEGEELPDHYEPKWEELTCQDRRTEEDSLLWPARFTQRHLDEDLKPALRAWGGSYAEAGQLQQRPAPRGGGMFQKEDFNFIDRAPKELSRVVRGWDLAATKDAGAWTVGCKMGLHDGKVYILDVQRGRWSPGRVETAYKACCEADGYNVVPSFPQDPGQAGKAQKADIASKLHGYSVHFSPESGSKEDRAKPLAAQAEAGNLYLVRGPWNDVFVNEACMFPNGQFKDQIDAASRAYMRLIMKKPRMVGAAPQVLELRSGF
jgi:predicted phage terminase large subunit-like protein